MKILYVDLAPIIGGSIVSLEQLLRRLDRREFEPTVVLAAGSPAVARLGALLSPGQVWQVPVRTDEGRRTKDEGRPETGDGRRTTGVGRLLRRLPLWAAVRSVRELVRDTLPTTARLVRIIRATRPDLVHANDAVFVSRPALLAARLTGVPAVCHVRSLAPWSAWDRRLARGVRSFIYISEWVAADAREQGVPPERGRVIHNGVDLTPYHTLPDRAAARRALGLPLDRPIVAVVARLERWKGQDLFLRAWPQVADAVPRALGLVVGEVAGFGGAYAAELRVLAADARAQGLADDALRFMPYCADIPTLLAALDVLAHTSVAPEPFGRVLIEAMAAGLPVVTPAEGGGLEIVADGVTGLLVAPRYAPALAAALIRLLSDAPAAAALGAAGRARVAEHFAIEPHVKAVSELYREIAGK